MKKLAVKKFLSSLLESEQYDLTAEEKIGYFAHFKLNVFENISAFQEIGNNLKNIKGCGQLNAVSMNHKVVARTGEFTLKSGAKFNVATVDFPDTLFHYFELREEGTLCGFGNIWDCEAEKKQVFAFDESRNRPYVWVIKTPKYGLLNAEFYTPLGEKVGKLSCRKVKKSKKNPEFEYKFIGSTALWGDKNPEFVKIAFIQQKNYVEAPLYRLENLYKKSPELFHHVSESKSKKDIEELNQEM